VGANDLSPQTRSEPSEQAVPRVAIIDPDAETAARLTQSFAENGFQAWAADSAETFYRSLLTQQAELVVTELDLPGEDGLHLIKTLRETTAKGVLVITRRNAVEARIEARANGADEFLSKPLHTTELMLAAKALWARIQGAPNRTVGVSAAPLISLDPAEGVVRAAQGTQSVRLSSQEFALIRELAKHPNQVLSKEALHQALFPKHKEIDPHRIEVIVSRIRKKTQQAGLNLPIRAIFGRGLCMVLRVSHNSADAAQQL